MKNEKLNLDKLVLDLKQLTSEKQLMIKGGDPSTVVLPSVVISGSHIDDEPDPGDDPYFDEDIDNSYGGSNNDDPGETDPDENINDPNGFLENLKTGIQQAMQILGSGQLPPGITEEYAQEKMEQLQEILNLLERMESSDETFRIELGEVGEGGEVYLDTATGEIVVTFENENDWGLIVHELEHVEQYLDGEFTFDDDGNPVGFNIDHEVEAFQAQYEYNAGPLAGQVDWDGNPSPGWEVTEEWLLDRFPQYGDLVPDDEGDGGQSGSSGGGGN